MLSHPYGVVTLFEVEHQERMREAAQDRRAATAQRSAPARSAWLRTAAHAATSWLRGPMPRVRGAQRVHTAPSLAPD